MIKLNVEELKDIISFVIICDFYWKFIKKWKIILMKVEIFSKIAFFNCDGTERQ